MITPALLSWTWLSLALLVAGLFLGNIVLLAGAVFLFVAVLAAGAIRPPEDVVIERSLPRVICWVGDSLIVERRLTVRSGVGPIRVVDPLPEEAAVVEGNNFRTVWKWPGEVSADLSYTITFAKRGEYTLQETVWESQAPLGTGHAQSGAEGPELNVLVAPRTADITRLNSVRAMTRSTLLMDDIAHIRSSGEEFRELRPYQPGDPIKSINWKATARNGDAYDVPLVNELEPEGRKAIWIFLDTADYMNVGTAASSPMENTIEAAGTLAQYYVSQGSTLGAYAYNTQGGGELLSPDNGQKQFRRLTQMFTGLTPGPPEQDLLRSVEWCKSFLFRLRPQVFIITRLDAHYPRPGDDSEQLDRLTTAVIRLTALRARSRRGGRVRVIHVSPPSQHESGGWADPQSDMSRWETQATMAALQQAGAAVMDWDPSSERFITTLVRHMDRYQ